MSALLRDLALHAGARNPIALAEDIALLMKGSYVTRQVTGNHAAATIGCRIAAARLADELPAPKPRGTRGRPRLARGPRARGDGSV